jgi:citrate lyase subunit beta/citryl-CoA lyase
MVNKAAHSEADCVVIDLEDAVPKGNKGDARLLISKTLSQGIYSQKTVFVRINPLETGLTLLDLDAVACSELHGFVYPMAYTPDNIKNFDAQLRLKEMTLGLPIGHFSLIVLIETPLAVLNAYDIAKASDRVVGLLFGCEDYLADMQARHSENDMSLHTPRSQVALAARAADVEPIDTPYVRVHDLDGLRDFAMRARDLGMAGMLVMTPKQIPIAHEVYSPSNEEIETAKEIVKAAEQAEKEGRGIVVVNGIFISPPTLKAAMKVHERKRTINQLNSGKSLL